MCLPNLQRTTRKIWVLASVFSSLRTTFAAESLSNEVLQLKQEQIDTVVGFLVAGALILLMSVVLMKCRSQRKRSWDKGAEERAWARLVEDSVGVENLTGE